MNIKNKILIILILGFLSINSIFADEKKNVLDEELPAVNPFLSGAGAASGGLAGTNDGTGNSISLDNLKLSGIIFGEDKRFAIFSFPDGTTIRYSEDTIIRNDLILLDIFIDRVYIKLGEQEYSVDMKNNIIKVQG
tara:strand:+ start:638 stop:1045 length:408 start_codon:yes stop_codon:yes gene_type:complete